MSDFELAKLLLGAREFAFVRAPSFVATHLQSHFEEYKLLFYGDGAHTAEVLAGMGISDNIVGVVRNAQKDDFFIPAIFKVPLYDIDTLDSLSYDKLVLLGYWTAEKIQEFALTYSIDTQKIWNVYADKEVVENSKRLLRENVTNLLLNLQFSSTKARLALIVPSDYRDFVTMASDEIAKIFSLTKIYIFSNSTEDNSAFDNVLYCNGDLYFFEELVRHSFFDLVVFQNMSQKDNVLVRHVRDILANRSKFIVASADYSLNGFTDFTDEQLADIFTLGNRDALLANKNAEIELLRTADGYIVNYAGKHFDELIANNAKSAYSSICMVSEKSFCLDRNTPHFNDNKLIDIVYAGSVPVPGTVKYSASDVLPSFLNILEQNTSFAIHIFSSWKNREMLQIAVSHERMLFHDFVPHYNLPSMISGYHFGLIWVNFEGGAINYKPTCEAIINAKMLTYLAAGLPIIIDDVWTQMCNMIRYYKIGIVVNHGMISGLEQELLRLNYSDMCKNVRLFQKEFLSENHPAKLAAYLWSIHKKDASDKYRF